MTTPSTEPAGLAVAQVIPLRGWRKGMAERMLRSHMDHAQVTQMREVDVTELAGVRERVLADPRSREARVSFTHLLIKAAAQAIRQHAIVNSSLVENEIRVYVDINVGMAVALEDGGLLAPVVRQADQKSIWQVAQEAIALTERARTKRLSLDDLAGGTFTVTNAGMYGTDFVTPLLTGAQSAALGVGRIVPKPVVRDGQIVVRSMMGLSLAYDHQVFAGATAAQFFQTMEQLIEEPSKLELGG